MRLQAKISAWVLLVVVAIGIIVTWTVVVLQRQASVREFNEVAGALARVVKNGLRQDMLENRRDDIRQTVVSMRRGPLINEIVIFGPKSIVAVSADTAEEGRRARDPDVAAALRTGKARTRYETKDGNEEFCLLLPVENEAACYQCHDPKQKVLGVVEVGLRTEPLARQITSDTRTIVLIQLLGLALVLVNLTVAMRHAVVRRLDRMLTSIKQITQGDLAQRVSVDSKDEVGQLAEAFNEMQDTVESTIDELQKAYHQLDRSLLRFGKLLGTTLNINEMADLILNELADVVDARQACLFLRERPTDRMLLLASRGVFQEVVNEYNAEPVVWGRAPYTTATFRSDAAVVRDAGMKQSLAELSRCHDSKDFFVFSLITTGRVVGLLTLVGPEYEISKSKIHTLQALCHEAATAVETAHMHERLEVVSITDALTQTYNQRHFFTVLKEEMDRAKRYGGAFSLVFLDLDNFKLFNDTFGHLAGDTILRQVSTLLSHLVRVSDRVFRYGGDEFVLILPDTPKENALVLAGRVREEIARRNFVPRGETATFRLTASIGVTSFEATRFAKEDEIFKAVDDALYRAKEAGRNRVVIG